MITSSAKDETPLIFLPSRIYSVSRPKRKGVKIVETNPPAMKWGYYSFSMVIRARKYLIVFLSSFQGNGVFKFGNFSKIHGEVYCGRGEVVR